MTANKDKFCMMTTNGIFSIFYGTAAADCGQCDQMLELKGSPNVDKSCSNSRNSVSYKNDPLKIDTFTKFKFKFDKAELIYSF